MWLSEVFLRRRTKHDMYRALPCRPRKVTPWPVAPVPAAAAPRPYIWPGLPARRPPRRLQPLLGRPRRTRAMHAPAPSGRDAAVLWRVEVAPHSWGTARLQAVTNLPGALALLAGVRPVQRVRPVPDLFREA